MRNNMKELLDKVLAAKSSTLVLAGVVGIIVLLKLFGVE
jgi:hypothetical protein